MVAKTGVAKKVAVVKTTKSSSNVKKATISYEDMLKGFNTIPRKAETGKSISKNSLQSMKSDKSAEKNDERTKEKQAVKDMKRLLVLMEKSIIGEISDKELHEIASTGRWLGSIAVLKEYVETLCIK